MATFRARVEAYVGAIPDDQVSRLETFLLSGARLIISLIRIDVFKPFAQAYAIGVGGLSTLLLRLSHVTRSGIGATVGANEHESFITDPLSIFYATERSPVALTKSSLLRVYPAGGSSFAWGITFPTVVNATDTMLQLGLPQHLDEGMILYAAQRYLLSTAVTNFTEGTYTAPTLSIASELTLLGTYLNTQEDIELAQAEMQAIKAKIEEYRARIENATQEATFEIQNARLLIDRAQAWVTVFGNILFMWREWLNLYAMVPTPDGGKNAAS